MRLIKELSGKLFGDKGYIKKELAQELQDLGITLITPLKKNMKARLIPINIFDLIMSKKRVLIESVFNILKNKLQLCHTRHRSIKNFCVHILAVLVGYQLTPNKPSINLESCNLLAFNRLGLSRISINSKNKLSDLKQKQAKLNDLVLQLRKAQAKLEADAKLAKASPNKSITKNKIPAKSSVGNGVIDDNSPLLSRRLTNPIDAPIAIGFGKLRDGVPNSGVVFDTPNNAHVYAISNGKVLYSGTLPGFGQLVVVDNGNDYNSIYSGVISFVKKGDTVSGGQVIASSDAPDNQPMGGVYFELRHLGRPINSSSVFH